LFEVSGFLKEGGGVRRGLAAFVAVPTAGQFSHRKGVSDRYSLSR
jgi:hypothetical protein